MAKKFKKSSLHPQILHGYYFDHLAPTEKKQIKRYPVLVRLRLKKKFGYQNLHLIFKISLICENSPIFHTSSRNQSSIDIISCLQSFIMVQKQKNTWKLFKVWKLGAQNFAFLDTFGHLASLQPNPLSQLPQILHTSCQAPGASSCKILGHVAKFRLHFLAKNP